MKSYIQSLITTYEDRIVTLQNSRTEYDTEENLAYIDGKIETYLKVINDLKQL